MAWLFKKLANEKTTGCQLGRWPSEIESRMRTQDATNRPQDRIVALAA